MNNNFCELFIKEVLNFVFDVVQEFDNVMWKLICLSYV